MTDKVCDIHLVAGTRPNVMKIAPLYKVLKEQAWCQPKIVFLEQHVSENMGSGIFRQLGVNDDLLRLPIERGNLGDRLGSIISEYGALIRKRTPDLVVIPGDVDVSLGATIAAKRGMCTVAHLEAGLRSNDKRMPEELNRILIDSIADILLAPSEAAADNLIFGEGHSREEVHFVGNIMIDSLRYVLNAEKCKELLERHGLEEKRFGVATFHRPSNVDVDVSLENIVDLICNLSRERKIVFPIHPRTEKRLSGNLYRRLADNKNILALGPLPYDEFINLISGAQFVVTDSGGIQEETSYLGVPCFTLRESTERPITTINGTNMLVSFDDISVHTSRIEEKEWKYSSIPLWDGETSYRCAHLLNTWWRGKALR